MKRRDLFGAIAGVCAAPFVAPSAARAIELPARDVARWDFPPGTEVVVEGGVDWHRVTEARLVASVGPEVISFDALRLR